MGELEQACEVLLEVLDLLKSSKNYFGAAHTLILIVSMYQVLGKNKAAISICEETIQFIEDNQWEEYPPSGLVNVVYADLLIDLGDYQAAVDNLEAGRNLIEPISSIPIRKLVDRVEEKIGNVSTPPEEFQVPLTAREIEVLTLVAEGLSNREVSERLYLSLDTVKGHNRKIFGKLGVKNRTQAVNKAISLKIIPPSTSK